MITAIVVAVLGPGIITAKVGDSEFQVVTPINSPAPAEGAEIVVRVQKQGDTIVHAWHIPGGVADPVEAVAPVAVEAAPVVDLMQEEPRVVAPVEPAPADHSKKKKK